MDGFADVINAEEAQAIQAYVINQAVESTGWGHQLLNLAAGSICIPQSWVVD